MHTSNVIYEEIYNKDDHFSFGKNWTIFLESLTDERIEEAKKSLINFFGDKKEIQGKTFLDVGCGSGLFSYAAFLLGAKQVVSVDIDDFSMQCVETLRKKVNNPENWVTQKGSALNSDFIKNLGDFDIVYSWGVLHHTGDMKSAFKNVMSTVRTGGMFYTAIYNKNTRYVLEGTSKFWWRAKQWYNRIPQGLRKVVDYMYAGYILSGVLILKRENPVQYVQSYINERGMSFLVDVRDWLGGFPYEYASVKEMEDFFGEHDFVLVKVKEARSLGCNEFLFKKK